MEATDGLVLDATEATDVMLSKVLGGAKAIEAWVGGDCDSDSGIDLDGGFSVPCIILECLSCFFKFFNSKRFFFFFLASTIRRVGDGADAVLAVYDDATD